MKAIFIIIFFLTPFTYVLAQSNFFKSEKHKFKTIIDCIPAHKIIDGTDTYSCTSSKFMAIYRISVEKLQQSETFVPSYVDAFFDTYKKQLTGQNVAFKTGSYKGLKTLEYIFTMSGAWIKQIIFLKYGRSYTLSVTTDAKANAEILMSSFKNEFRFIDE